MKKLNQKGMVGVEGLLVAIIVLLVGFIGYYVYHSQQQANKTLNTAQADNASTVSTKKSTSSSTASSQKFLTIKEWGVKLPLSDTDSHAYYTYSAASGDQLADSAVVFDTSIDDLSNTDNISCKDPGYPLMVVSRIKPSDIPKTQDINSQYYIGDTGPTDFSAPSFSSQYEFAASTHNQAAPRCEILNNGSDDGSIGSKYSAIAAALSSSYSKMQQE